MNFHLHGSPEKVKQHSNSFFGRQESRHDHFESSKRSIYNVNRLANFEGRINGYDLVGASLRLKCRDDLFRQDCQALSKPDDSPDSVGAFNRPMLGGKDKSRKQIARKHSLHEPHWPSLGQLAKP